jgi:RNA polymerase sigma-70 factor (ECF subfamily)
MENLEGSGSMNEQEALAERFEADRGRLKSVAYQMLGSLSEAEDAVQEAWLRLSRSDTSGVESLSAWLTTVVGRVCLDMLRSRKSRREEDLEVYVPDPVVSRWEGSHAEQEMVLADSVGLALLVVLETLNPAERLAFVLHDLFGLPFDEIAPIVGRNPAAARQLASRARRRVQGAPTAPDADLTQQREVVDAFITASRSGDVQGLLAVLDPDVVLRLDRGAAPQPPSREVRGAQGVIDLGFRFGGNGWVAEPALVNGAPGLVVRFQGKPFSVMGFTVRGGRIAAIDILADPERVPGLGLEGI